MQRSDGVCLPCGFLQRTRKAQHRTEKWTKAALTRKEEDELFKNILLIQPGAQDMEEWLQGKFTEVSIATRDDHTEEGLQLPPCLLPSIPASLDDQEEVHQRKCRMTEEEKTATRGRAAGGYVAQTLACIERRRASSAGRTRNARSKSPLEACPGKKSLGAPELPFAKCLGERATAFSLAGRVLVPQLGRCAFHAHDRITCRSYENTT